LAIFGIGKKKVNSHSVFTLTPVGREKAQSMEASGKTLAFLDYLDQSGASSLPEIAEQAKINNEDAEVLAKKLVRLGYIQPVNANKE
jgi:DNA-binding MarR family transcriptional regulator